MNKISFQDHICIITLDNKPQNYLDRPEFVDTQKLTELVLNKGCKAILITGGGRHFSAGANLEKLWEMAQNDTLKEEIILGKKLLSTLKKFKLPIIACIEGICFGGGLEIALSADIKIAGTKALFAFPESNMGIIPGLGGTRVLSRITGVAKALELVLSGNIIDAETAKDLKIVDYLIDSKTTLMRGLEIAKSITEDRGIEIINAVVEVIRSAEKLPHEMAMERETELFCKLAKKAVKYKIMQKFTGTFNINDFANTIGEEQYPKYFTELEREIFGKKQKKGSLTARYLLKTMLIENVDKSLKYTDIEILNNLLGKPVLTIKTMDIKQLERVHFSISHSKDTAIILLLID